MGFALLCSPNRRDTDLGHMLRLRRWRRCVTTVWPAACLFDNYGFPHWLLSTKISMMCWLRIQVLWDTCLLAVNSCSLWENLSSLLVLHFEMWLDTASLTVLRKILTYWFLFTRVIQSSSWCFASLTSVCFDCPRFVWKDIHAGSVCPTKVFQPAVTYP